MTTRIHYLCTFTLIALLMLFGFAAQVSAAVQSMKLLTPQVGWTANDENLFWTTDGGMHWKNITPQKSSNEVIVDVFFLDTNMGWALLSGGDENAEEPQFELASTTNGGNHWRVVRVNIPDLDPRSTTLDGRGTIFFVDQAHGWMNLPVVSSAVFRLGNLLLTDDGGKTWTWAPGGSGAGAGSLYFATATDGWTAGGPDDGELYVTHDGAKSWQEVALKAPPDVTAGYTPSYDLPVFPDRKHGFLPVTYSHGDKGQAILVLFSSEDSGQTWETDQVLRKWGHLSGGEKIPVAVADSVLLAAPDSNDGTIPLTAVSPAAKENTTVASVPSRRFALFNLSFANPSHGWASTSEGLLSTQDGGTTWMDITPSAEASGTGHSTRTSIRDNTAQGGRGVTHAGIAEPAGLVLKDTHLGFDTCSTPTTEQMETWWVYSPFYDIAVYLGGQSYPSTCNNDELDEDWVSTVAGFGWGIIPVWSGLQAPCACVGEDQNPATCKKFARSKVFSWDPATALIQGTQAANAAAEAAKALLLPTSVIYLDIEQYSSTYENPSGQSCGVAAQNYLEGWVSELKGGNNNFTVEGVYGAPADAQTDWSQISQPPDDVWISKWGTPSSQPVTIWGLNPLCDLFSASPCPLWSAQQRIHQYLGGHKETWGGMKMEIDSDIVDADVSIQSVKGKSYIYGSSSYVSLDASKQFPEATQTGASGINDLGKIVGYYFDANGAGHGFLYSCDTPTKCSKGVFTALNDPMATSGTFPVAINNSGVIVGSYGIGQNAYTFLVTQYGAGNYVQVSVPGYPTGINDDGLIVGYYVDANGNYHGYFYNYNVGGNYYDGGVNTYFYGINGDAQIVGADFNSNGLLNGFLYDAASAVTTTLPYNTVAGVNSSLEMILWPPGDLYEYGSSGATTPVTYPGSAYSEPYAINDYAQAVGVYVNNKGVTLGYVATSQQ